MIFAGSAAILPRPSNIGRLYCGDVQGNLSNRTPVLSIHASGPRLCLVCQVYQFLEICQEVGVYIPEIIAYYATSILMTGDNCEKQAATHMDDEYLENHIKHISDRDLFSSLKLSSPELAAVERAARAEDPDRFGEAWAGYLRNRLAREAPAGESLIRGDLDPDQPVLEADLIVARDIKCWSGTQIKYQGEVDFSRNLKGSSNYGFHYFGWIAPLKWAYESTGDERYARAFVEIFTQWYRQRDLVKGDFPVDVIWYELGCQRARAFRDLCFSMIEAQACRESEFHVLFLKTMLGHGRWLHRHETAYTPGNWQVCGLQTLIAIGLSFPEFRESIQWVRRGLRWLLEHTRRDVYPDGCHRERAFIYHQNVLNQFWDGYAYLEQAR